uniref:Uncharacterized protein n=1 Tax=Rhizophora mucronata TaxID=61149 RepID=A0A2P2R1F5_RHIMU
MFKESRKRNKESRRYNLLGKQCLLYI